MKAALAEGPIKVSIQADASSFHTYAGGIYDDEDCGHVHDHAVTLVGWGSESGAEYWILRNSWGASWGEEGYMRMAIEDSYGICGVNTVPVSVHV